MGKQTVCSQIKKKNMAEEGFHLNTQINPNVHFKASAKYVVLGRFRTETSPAFFPVRSQPLVHISAEDKAAPKPQTCRSLRWVRSVPDLGKTHPGKAERMREALQMCLGTRLGWVT